MCDTPAPDKTIPELAVSHKGAGGPGITENSGDLGDGPLSVAVLWP